MTVSLNDSVRSPERLETLGLSNGRKLAWSEWGPSSGKPVLFLTGAGMAGSLGFGLEHLDDLDIRLISPDRPGLGDSDPDLEKTLQSVAVDLHELVRHFGQNRMPVAAFSQGAAFALALAASGAASCLAIVSGQDDLSFAPFQEGLPDQVRQMVEQAGEDPAGLVAMLEGFAEPKGFYDFILLMSSQEDRAIYSSEPFATAYLRALEKGFVQGAKGYALDTLAALGPWGFDLCGVTCPVALWYGGKDTSPVHSPDFGRSLANRLPNAYRRFLAEEGGALLWTRSRDILLDLV